MSRPRNHNNRGLPTNLYYDKTNKIFRYNHPVAKKYYYLGRDRLKAISAAKQLNTILMPGQDLVAKVLGTAPTLAGYIDNDFVPNALPARKLAQATLTDYKNKLVAIKQSLGEFPLDSISVKQISDFLKTFPPTQANRYRSLMVVIFKHAVSEGHCDSNPAEITLNRKIQKSRKRLTLDAFRAIYELADQWLKNAMDLALVTLQRREEIASMKFNDIKDGYLFVIQKKTAKHGSSAFLKIKIGRSLAKIIDRCDDGTGCSHIIHRARKTTHKKDSQHVLPVTKDYITKSFSKARDDTGLFSDIPTNQRPTFHELRSLGIKLYEETGIDAQRLAGHTSREMTERYKAGHDITWTETAANLEI